MLLRNLNACDKQPNPDLAESGKRKAHTNCHKLTKLNDTKTCHLFALIRCSIKYYEKKNTFLI